MNQPFDISVILCTYNRCESLKSSIASLLAQDCPAVRYELIVVDNHSTDHTRQVCDTMLSQSAIPARYLFESRQGVSFARNAAIQQAKAPILAFFDDDVCVSKNWLANIKRLFAEHPEISGLGGKVLPQWPDEIPVWLTQAHWMPLALQDYGDQPLRINNKNPLGLVAANLALRREVFDRIGLFSPDLQRVKDSIGSMEDHELHLRLWEAGFQEMYCPELIVTTEVQAERLTKAYHRKWNEGHGHFYALLRDPEFERSAARLFDVPAHLYKQSLVDLLDWCKKQLAGNHEQAFLCETRLCFFRGFFHKRRQEFHQANHFGLLREIASFLYALMRPHNAEKVR
jgi:glycosyltransferase involved in cell wall biosynthesis